jgi:hypothetical protein
MKSWSYQSLGSSIIVVEAGSLWQLCHLALLADPVSGYSLLCLLLAVIALGRFSSLLS